MEDPRAREFSRLVAKELAHQASQRGVLQKDVAVAAGITPQHFSHTIAGRKGALTVGVLLRAAERLDLDPQLIVARAYEDLVRSLGAPAEPATPRSDRKQAASRRDHAPSPARARDGAGTRTRRKA